MHHLTVLGTGVLGSQILFQAAYFGKDVVAYDLNDEILAKLPQRWEYLKPLYLRDLPDATPEKLDAAVARITATSDLGEALASAELVIEAVPEKLEIKRSTWERVGALAPATTIFATNTSTMLPSDIASASGHPERFLALHFANEVWKNNTGEVMGHAGTSPEAFEAVAEFAEEIGMVPIRVMKEQPGYVLNSLLIPLLEAAGGLLTRGVASPEDIDLTWRKATGAPTGPFQMIDSIGMTTAHLLSEASDSPDTREFAKLLQRDYIDKGWLGKGSGRGFYTYE